jgi:hypothetical protein
MKRWKKKSKNERRVYHEKVVEDRFTAYELTDSENFDNRQKARNVLRYQIRGYCFELPPTCTRYGKRRRTIIVARRDLIFSFQFQSHENAL